EKVGELALLDPCRCDCDPAFCVERTLPYCRYLRGLSHQCSARLSKLAQNISVDTMARYRRGLIVGKFSPLHKGHEFLINRATEACSEVVILSYSSPEFPDCEAARREEWLRSLFPDARVVVVTREAVRAELGLEMPANDADDLLQRRFLCELWEKSVNEPLNAIFTSENYGDGFAQFFSEYFRKKGW